MDEVIASSVQVRRSRTVLLSLFAVLALALAAIGTYGAMAYTVAQRSQEIGIRVALGARQNQVRMLVIGEGMRLGVYGVGLGLVISLALTRLLSGSLYGIKSTDPLPLRGQFLCSLSPRLLQAG